MARFINHQKQANCILERDGNKFFLYSIRDINSNEELTCDYTLLKYPFINTIEGYKEL
jgi:SET domain-containing protein